MRGTFVALFACSCLASGRTNARADRTKIDIGALKTLSAGAVAQVLAAAATKESKSPSMKSSVAEPRSRDQKSRSIMQMLEARESDFTICLAIALAGLIVGGLCGGRPHRARARQLRFSTLKRFG